MEQTPEEVKKKSFKKMIVLNDRQREMLAMVRKQTGAPSDSAVIYRGLEELYGKLFPAYKFGGGTTGDKDTAVSIGRMKAETKIESKKVMEEAKWAPKIEMCENMLHGEVQQRGSGRVCVFKMHTPSESIEQTIPLIQVDPIVAETSLFSPDKDTVLASREDLRKQFS